MSAQIADKIAARTGVPNLVAILAEQLSSSELNSLLLEVYEQKARQLTPAALLEHYRRNTYVAPETGNMVQQLERELQVLQYFEQHHYQPVPLAPVVPFGTCSVLGTVSQHKILTAVRHTEVLSDATNALALYIAAQRKSGGLPLDQPVRYATIHQHIRASPLPPLKGYSRHFRIACMVAAGIDTGNYVFERLMVQEQLVHIYEILRQLFGITQMSVRFMLRGGYPDSNALMTALEKHLQHNVPFEVSFNPEAPENNYYKGIQFKVYIPLNENSFEIADGGFVDWTQQLTGNRKERCLISGIGLGLLTKILSQ